MTEIITIPYKFTPRPYQKELLKAIDQGYRRAIVVYHRRAGKDKTMFNIMVKKSLQRKGVYYYFFPEYAQGRRVIWDGMDASGFKFLDHIPSSLVQSKNSTDMKILLTNGSVIQILGTDKFDKVRGSNPVGCVFSEFAFQNPKAWNIIRPILAENKGWAIFNSCVTADTLVLGENGFEEIYRDLPQGYTNINSKYFGLNNEFHLASEYFVAGEKETLIIKTKSGYEIECTPEHQLWTGTSWKRSDQYNIGEEIVIQRNMQVFGKLDNNSEWKDNLINDKRCAPSFLSVKFDNDLMYELGQILAEGYINPKQNYVVVTTFDKETQDFFISRGYVEEQTNPGHFRKCSKYFVDFLEWFGFKFVLAKEKTIPKKVFNLTKSLQSSFLSGYFDGDGFSDPRGRVGSVSSSKKLTKELQILLLNYGIVSYSSAVLTPKTKLVNVESMGYRLEIGGYNSKLFFNQIGFRLKRKQDRVNNLTNKKSLYWNDTIELSEEDRKDIYKAINGSLSGYKSYKRISYNSIKKSGLNKFNKILDDNFYYDKIVSIEKSKNLVYDFVIPDTHSFHSNGFISHNTPNGRNHFFDMYQMAYKNKNWFTQNLDVTQTLDENGNRFITDEMIQEERDSGMSEELIQQEYYNSWIANSQGFYYLSLIEQAESEGRIGKVPYIPSIPVETFWDIGVGDYTCIWFAQTTGKEINVIDYYAANNKGIDHYAKVLQSKNYVYKSHNVPWDMGNVDFSTGRTRLEVAEELFRGTRVNLLPKLPKEEGRNAVRMILPSCNFDANKCKDGLDGLRNYRKAWDDKHQIFTDSDVHDWASDPADAFRYLAIGITMPKARSYKNEFMKSANRVISTKNWKIS